MKAINRRGIALVMGMAIAAMIASCNMADSFSGDDDGDNDRVTSLLLDRQSVTMEVGAMDIAWFVVRQVVIEPVEMLTNRSLSSVAYRRAHQPVTE